MDKTKNKKKICGSKTNKNISGSKTAKPLEKVKEIENEINHNIDVDKIFDIIKSETKREVNDITEKKNQINTDNISKNAIQSYLETKKFLEDHNISISTITLDCKLHTLIDVDKFAKNVILREGGIVNIKFGNRKDPVTNRTIVFIKNKKKQTTKNFYNQVTILMKPSNNLDRNYINIKVFKNGSLQMTGCKDMEDFNNVTNTLIRILVEGRDVVNKNGKIIHINFIDNPEKIGIFDIKIRMINSNFKLDYKVDRKKLARLLKKYHNQGTKDKEIGYVECKYEPTGGHSCVNIKYKYDDKHKPSIFVFQTGAIIITGAKNLHHIVMAYHFIQKILQRYYNEIRIIELDPDIVRAEIARFFRARKIKEQRQQIEI